MARARKELILHIGMGKTGTTALQQAFWRNRDLLARHGIAYPVTGAVAAAHHLITPRIPGFLANSGWAFLKPAEWVPQVLALPQKRVLMSSELIAWSDPASIESFCAALRDRFILRICMYLRRQDNIIMASYSQQIKAGLQLHPISSLTSRPETFDYLQKLWPWEKALGAGQLIVLPYEQAQFHEGDLLHDVFHRVLDMALPRDFDRSGEGNPNPRLGLSATEYKRLVNLLFREPAESGRFNDPLFAFSAAEDASHDALFQDQALLSPQERGNIMNHYLAGNAYIARKFLGREDGILFHEPVAKAASPAGTVTEGDLARISAFLVETAPDLLANLRSRIDALLKTTNVLERDAVKRLGDSLAGIPATSEPAPQDPAVATSDTDGIRSAV
jgi:hypothetical protein